MHLSTVHNSANRLFDFICLWILPIGFLLLVIGMFFLPERGIHQKLYYGLFSIPTLLALCLRPSEWKPLWREPIIVFYVAFAGFAILSLTWSDTGEISRIKRPLHLFMLFAGMCLLLRYRFESLQPVLLAAAVLALGATGLDLYQFSHNPVEGQRLIGSGVFDNPLLSSHLFGFFCVYWLFVGMTSKNLRMQVFSVCAFVVMFAAVLATGSRTPLVAITLATIWIGLLCWNLRSVLILIAALIIAATVVVAFPEMITGRGDSYRFDIWKLTLQLISQRPLIGHGFGASFSVDPGVGYLLSEPHNFFLGVLYYVGIAGLVPWLAMQAHALISAWRHRAQPLFILVSALLVFGIGAGLTEGGGILSRVKEHWFLLWIPLAMIAALNVAWRTGRMLTTTVRSLSRERASALTRNAHVIEEDGLGPKVLRLEDGSFLKLFRRRRWYTSGSFNPYSERFAKNSQHLATLGFTTPTILDLYRFADGSTGVRYQPLPGRTLRQVLETTVNAAERQALVLHFGRFLAKLHEHGVYFRSLHLGNVLLLDNGELGLIDLADMRILPSALTLELRQRNLRHMQRYAQDRSWLFEEHVTELLKGYADLACDSAVKRIHELVQPLGHAG
jgi:O-antigen ligase/tRNA A-37 threonylcarbamoyl transferase component Bud32